MGGEWKSCTGRWVSVLCLVLFMVVSSNAEDTPSWVIKGNNDNACIEMAFSATVKFEGTEHSVEIPQTDDTDGSLCSNDSSTFTLTFPFDATANVSHNGTVSFRFSKTKDEWSLSEVMTALDEEPGQYKDVSNSKFSASNGFYLQCTSKLEIEEVDISFTTIEKMQPFVGKDDEAQSCEEKESSDLNIGLIVGCVLGGMAVLVITCFVCNRIQKRRQRKKRYQRDASGN